jgi:hypothetical protein
MKFDIPKKWLESGVPEKDLEEFNRAFLVSAAVQPMFELPGRLKNVFKIRYAEELKDPNSSASKFLRWAEKEGLAWIK